ncbi:MAG: ribosomal RNA small subunit methyltransferase A [bacterium]|nr:MAG: ribosomal RNA small subunit methyltransferase A [bacterium]
MSRHRYAPPAYGQHFLHDRNILSAIVAAARLSPGDAVIEVGVGTGRLTELLLARGVSLTGVEVDGNLIPALEEKFAGHAGFRLVKGDILRLPWEELLPPEGKAVLLGNLPYAISTQVLFRVLDHRQRICRAVFLVQWEVAVRITANPGTKDFGILAVACQLYGRPRIVRKVPPGVFLPPPRVDSALVSWELSAEPLYRVPDRAFAMRVVKAAFGQRRKKLVNSLGAGFPDLGRDAISLNLGQMGLDPSVRAEELSVAQFAELACRLSDAVTR